VELPGQNEVGSKVSIRLHNENPDEGLFRDLLGILESPISLRKKMVSSSPSIPIESHSGKPLMGLTTGRGYSSTTLKRVRLMNSLPISASAFIFTAAVQPFTVMLTWET